MTKFEYQPFDKSSKWMIQHHGDSMLRLAKIDNIEHWRPAPAEIIQPRQWPDGLLEVRLQGQSEDDYFLLEVATYPERRINEQMTRDQMLVYLERGTLPEAVTLVLRPRGKYRIPRGRKLRSRLGLSSSAVHWTVIELWTVPAEQLLEANDVGLIPWLPLTAYAEQPERIVETCREVIEQDAPPGTKENLLAITQVFTRLRYNDAKLLTILGGTKAMIESPLIQELISASKQEDILTVLEARFGAVPQDLAARIQAIGDEKQLKNLVQTAASCSDLDAFRRSLPG